MIAWQYGLKRVHWLPAVACAVLIIGMTIGRAATDTPATVALVLETVIPLVIALQAAMLFVPGSEPALGIQIAAPRPIAWVPLERLVVVFSTQAGVALIGAGLAAAVYPDLDIGLAIVRWIPSAVFLSSIAFTMTIHSGEVALGAVFVALFWGIMLALGDALLPQPGLPAPFDTLSEVIWLIHAYLQPDDLDGGRYLINRLVLVGVGGALYALSFHHLSDTENLLE